MNHDFFEWIAAHAGDDPARLRLKHGRDRAAEILQIECRRRFGAKLRRTLESKPQFVFPTALSGEQSTSDELAAFHASLVAPGAAVADLTAGLGIDAAALATVAASVVAVERNPEVAEALKLNSPELEVVEGDCRDYVAQAVADGRRFDAVFIDPARRDGDGGRTYAFDRCEPDVPAMMPALEKITRRLIVKASPMLDITLASSQLGTPQRVIALGTTTECKELDFVVDFHDPDTETVIEAVTVMADGRESVFAFTRAEEAAAEAVYGVPSVGQYILEPFPAAMKVGAPKLLCSRFGVAKLAPNTHVWYGDEVPAGFPGRGFRITEVLPYASKHIKRYAAAHPRVGVTARNFDMTADALRSKLGVKDGPARLFAVSDATGARWLVTTE